MIRITVGVDAEAASRTAVDWLLGWPAARRAEITLVTAFDLLLGDPRDDLAVLEAERARIQAALPEADVQIALADGSIPGVLERRAAESDLLVIGAHRTRHARSVLTGDLPRHLAAHAGCPVVVVPDDVDAGTGGIVVGLADDASSDAALEFAATAAADAGTGLDIVHAWELPVAGGDLAVLPIDAEELRREHEERLHDAARGLSAHADGVAIEEHLHRGDAAFALEHVGRRSRLIVIGTHRRGPIVGFLLGSVGARLLRDSRVPVCVVPPVEH